MPRKLTDIAGQQYGDLTVVKICGRAKSGRLKWLCTCSCGSSIETLKAPLIAKISPLRSCGCKTSAGELKSGGKIKAGDVVEHLTAVEQIFDANRKNRCLWLFRCVCGTEKVLRSDVVLRSNRGVKSCGCMHPAKPHTDPESAKLASAKNTFKNRYSDGNLVFEDFLKLSQFDCYYCGARPSNKNNMFLRNKGNSSAFSQKYGFFIYNGLDRIDSSLPHNKNNVVPCCHPCNWSKSDRTQNEFEEWVMRAATHIQSRNE